MRPELNATQRRLFGIFIFFLNTSFTQEPIHKIIIIGGGPAGYAAAVAAANGKIDTLVIEGEQPGGQPTKAGDIKNFPSYKSINGGELVANMRDHAEELGAKMIEVQATKVDFSTQPFKVWTDTNVPLLAHAVIIATGSAPIKLNCPGEDKYWGKGVVVCAKCDGYLFKDKPIVIVGGGYSALREVGNLEPHTRKITIINPDTKLTGPQFLINKVQTLGVKVLQNYEVKQILGTDSEITGIEVLDKSSGKTSIIPTQGVLVGLGWRPNIDLFKGKLKLNPQNQIVITNDTETSIPGVFAAGDVTSKGRHQLFMAASAGFAAAMDAEKYLREKNII